MLKRLLYRLYERQLLTEIRGEPLPRHIGLIQDGHRRYSRDVGLATLADGYRIGAEKTEEVLMWCAELDIPTVTLWALSTDNLARPEADVADILEVMQARGAAAPGDQSGGSACPAAGPGRPGSTRPSL